MILLKSVWVPSLSPRIRNVHSSECLGLIVQNIVSLTEESVRDSLSLTVLTKSMAVNVLLKIGRSICTAKAPCFFLQKIAAFLRIIRYKF